VSYGDDVDAETALDRAARQAAAITIELGWQRYLDRRTFARMKEAMYQAVSGSARALTQTRTPHASTRTQKHTTTTTTATTKTSTFCRLSHLMTTWVPPNARYLDYCENLCVWFVTLSHTSLLANLRRVPLLMRCCGSCVLSRLLCSRRRYCSQESGSGEGRASHRHFVTTLNRRQPSLAIHTISNGTHSRHSVSCHPTQPINSSACSWMMLRAHQLHDAFARTHEHVMLAHANRWRSLVRLQIGRRLFSSTGGVQSVRLAGGFVRCLFLGKACYKSRFSCEIASRTVHARIRTCPQLCCVQCFLQPTVGVIAWVHVIP
jgi:hypothetical protein